MHDMLDNQRDFHGFHTCSPCDVTEFHASHAIMDEGITAEKLGVRGTKINCDSITEERIGEIVKLMRQRSTGTPPTPKVIRRRGTATIVEWQDGTQTKVIREQEHPDWGIFGAFCVALAKKVYGNKSRLEKAVKLADEERQLEEKRRVEAAQAAEQGAGKTHNGEARRKRGGKGLPGGLGKDRMKT